MPSFTPVDHDPFAAPQGDGLSADGRPRVVIRSPSSQPKFTPVDHDPFAAPSMAGDVAKSAGIGVVKGGIGMLGALGDLTDLGAAGLEGASNFINDAIGSPRYQRPKRGSVLDNIPTSGSIQKGVEGYTGDFYKPQTTAGEYAQTLGEFAPAAFGGGASAAARVARTAIPAATSETAGQATKGTAAEPVARFLGALAGGGVTALASRPGNASRAIAGQLPEGVTEQMVMQADNLMQDASRQGVRLAWPEALSQVAGRPVLTNVMRHLEASPQTEGRMATFFGDRPQRVEGAVRSELDNIAPANQAPSTIGPAAGRAAEGTVEDVRKAINATAKPYYDSASMVLLSPAEMAKVKALPGYEQARAAVRNDPQLNRYVESLPDESVGFLNEVKKQLDNSAQHAAEPLNTQGRNMQRAAGFGQDAEAVRNIAANNPTSSAYSTALDIESVGREKYLQPLLDGPLGKIAGKDTATKDAINALFPKNPLANSEKEISTAVSAISKRNPKAAADLVRAHAEGTFNEAARDLQTGPNQANGAKFRTALVGNPQQEANLKAAVEALPYGADRWQGFNKLLEVLEATGTRQGVGSRTAYNMEINKAQGAGGLARDAAKAGANPLKALQPLIDRYEQYKLGRNLDQLANVLTDPGSVNLLRAIARAPASSGQVPNIALRLATFTNASRTESPRQVNNR